MSKRQYVAELSGDAVFIQLTQGQWAIVDRSEWESRPILQTLWSAKKAASNLWYAYKQVDGKLLMMHHLLLGKYADHINGNGLDNRIANLRFARRAQNSMNRKGWNGGYKGVSFNEKHDGYQSAIQHDGKQIYLGFYSTAEEAAKAYNDKAIEYFGEYARLNDVDDTIVPVRRLPAKTTMLPGVSFDKRRNKFYARIKHHGNIIWLGYFETEEEAADCYSNKLKELRPSEM